MPRYRSVVSLFGAQATNCFRALHIAQALNVPWYSLNYCIQKERFPPPDFKVRAMRAWKRETLEAVSPELAAKVAEIAAKDARP